MNGKNTVIERTNGILIATMLTFSRTTVSLHNYRVIAFTLLTISCLLITTLANASVHLRVGA